MITIVITQDEKKIKEILGELLKKEGRAPYDKFDEKNGVIRIAEGGGALGGVSLKEKVIELEDSLYKEKKGVLYKAVLAEIEKPMIEYVLERTEGNQLRAARVLGINHNTMRAKIKKLAIDVNRWKP